MSKRVKFFTCQIFSVITLLIYSSVISAAGLDEYLKGRKPQANEVMVIPVSIRHGLESQLSFHWPLNDPNQVLGSMIYLKKKETAERAGLELEYELDKIFAAGYQDKNFFIIFYVFAKAMDCRRGYLIQKVKLTKLYLDNSGNTYKSKEQYLVEALKLNTKKEIKRADEHIKKYSLGNADSRKTIVECEIGCGVIPWIVDKRQWPYAANKLFHRIQKYSDKPRLYDKVKFNFSTTYSFEFEFDKKGKYSVKLPDLPGFE